MYTTPISSNRRVPPPPNCRYPILIFFAFRFASLVRAVNLTVVLISPPVTIASPTRTRESLKVLLNDEVIVDYVSNTVAGAWTSRTLTHMCSLSVCVFEPNLFSERSVSNAQAALHEVTPPEPGTIPSRLDEHQQNIIYVKERMNPAV